MITTNFIDILFEKQQGYVYTPYKQIGKYIRWTPKFFQWPQEREALLQHLTDFDNKEIYLSPALFTQERVNPSTFKGTRYLWAEFDGEVPENPEFEPTIKIQSSLPGHEHWYWRLDHFITNKSVIEDLTKRLTYHYGADLSGWDYQQVLRPPNTFNHKRNQPVVLLDQVDGVYSLEQFYSLPKAPVTAHTTIDKLNLPKLTLLLATYKWTPDALDLMHKDMNQGSRSDALARLAFECVEMGMSNEEIYVVLDDADKRWNKFTGREDRDRRLAGIISYTRSKKAGQYELLQKDQIVFRFQDFMNTEIKLEWVIKGVLPVAGSAVIFGAGGIGKSTFSLRMGMAIASGEEEFLKWKIERRQKVMFASLEMQHDELKQFFTDMNITPEDAAQLQDWFYIWPIGHAYPFDVRDQQSEVLKQIDQYEIKLLIIDSHALAMFGSIKDDDAVKKLNSFLNEDLRKERGCGYFFIHHPRKTPQGDTKKISDAEESFGSAYIGYNAQTVINLVSTGVGTNKLNLTFLKSRLTEGNSSLTLQRNSDRSFSIVEGRKASKIETKEASRGSNSVLLRLDD